MNDYNKDEVINSLMIGINKGKRAKHMKRVSQSILTLFLVVFTSFSVMVNVSSSFADSLIDIPVIGEIVELIRIGSGYEEAAEKGMFEKGDIVYQDEDYTLSLIAYYYSDQDLNLFFKLDHELEGRYAITNFELLDEKMNKIEGGSFGYGSFNDDNIENIDVNMVDRRLPDTLTVRFDITRNSQRESFKDDDIIIDDISVNLEKKIKDVSNLKTFKKVIKHDSIDFEFLTLEITPTTMNLQLNVSSEDKVFYDFKEIYIESGDHRYERISDGLVRSGDMTSGMTYYFKTPYFDDYESFEIVIDGIYVLPLDQSTILIDLEKKEMVKGIDEKISFLGIKETTTGYTVRFEGNVDERVSFSQYNGHYFSSTSTMSTETSREYHLEVEKEFLEDTIIEVNFSFYPNEIEMNKTIIIE